MKIFKKSADGSVNKVETREFPVVGGASDAPAPAGAVEEGEGINDLVDWYLNPDAPSPMVNQADGWTSDPSLSASSDAQAPAPPPPPPPDVPDFDEIAIEAARSQAPDDSARKVFEGVQNAISEPVETEYAAGQLPVRFERPPLTEELTELKHETKQALTKRLGSALSDTTVSEDHLQQMVIEGLADVLLNHDTSGYSEAQLDQLGDELLNDILGHGPIEPLLEDPLVSEIMVNGSNQVFVERGGRIFETSARFDNDAQVRRVIDRIVSRIGRRIDESSPMVDARLPDGSRVNAIIPPLAVDGPTLTIRKFSKQALTEQDLVAYNTLTWESVGLLRAFVSGKLNMLISGGTGSGKTTLLNVCSNFIPEGERVVTIEDSVELRLNQRHVVRLESRPSNIEGRGEISIRDLVKNSLRMRPDRIVVGECRSGEALDMLQAMNTGHDGSLTTLHANSPRDAIARLETLVLMAGMDLPIRAIREQIASAIDVIVQLNRLRDGTRRVTHITEVVGMEGERVTLADIFLLETQGLDENGNYIAELKPTGLRPMVAERLADHGIELRASLFGDPLADGLVP